MGRTVAIVGYPRSMWYRTATLGGLTSGAVTPATPRPAAELELLHDPWHLNRADVHLKLARQSSAMPSIGCPSRRAAPRALGCVGTIPSWSAAWRRGSRLL